MLRSLLAPALLLAPLLVPSTDSTPPVDTFRLHPAPEGPAAIPARGASLWDLLEGLEADTGTHFVADRETRQFLEDRELLLARPVEVPAQARWSTAESFLAEAGGYFEELRASAPRLIAVRRVDRSSGRSSTGAMPRPRFVPEEHLEAVAEFPATVIETSLSLPHVDARNLSNSMRALVTQDDFTAFVPAGDASALILRGTAARVAELGRLLRSIDAAEADAAERRAQGESGQASGGGACACGE